MNLVVATRNRGKISEFRALLSPFSIEPLPMPEGVTVVEDGETYSENASKKASAAARATGGWAVADDSGIEIDALDGAPGVHSARFLNGAGDDEKCAKILEMMAGRTRRSARFVVSVVVADPKRSWYVANAELRGEISLHPRGSNGFGYDPIFIPEGHNQTLAEISTAEKNRMSHRARAVNALGRFFRYFKRTEDASNS